jgi:hypothetical protein
MGDNVQRVFSLSLALLLAACASTGDTSDETFTTTQLASSAAPATPGRLYGIRIEPESNSPPYKRSLYRHWIKVPGTCFTVRDAVLAEESTVPVTTTAGASGRCIVATGQWHDPYLGRIHTTAAGMDVDHVVALKEAHVSGGHSWSPAKRQSFANNMTDPSHLIAVDGPENRRKGDKDPAKYLPPNVVYRCQYIAIWIHIKRSGDLSMDQAEAAKVREVKDDCDRRGITVTLRERPVIPNSP